MSMKDCPSCGATVPESAARCKECFHDFNEAPPRRTGGPIFLLGALAAMAVVGAFTFWWVASSPSDQMILVDGDSQSIIWTRKYGDEIETDRLAFADIAKLEYVIKASGSFEVVAVTTDGDRKVFKEDVAPIKGEAEKYAQLMDKPLEEIDKTHGFHKMD